MKIIYDNKTYTAEWSDRIFSCGKTLIIRDDMGKVFTKTKFSFGEYLFQNESLDTYRSILDDKINPIISKEIIVMDLDKNEIKYEN